MCWLDIVTNVVSDCVFVGLITLLLLLLSLPLRWFRLGKAQRFFGYQQGMPIRIYVSCFEHPGMKTKAVVNALEYESAIELRNALQQLQGKGIPRRMLDYLAGLVGLGLRQPEPEVHVSPLTTVNDSPYLGSLILIGGPVNNQLTKFYLQDTPFFRFNEPSLKYQKRDDDGYHDLEPSDDVAIIEKRVIGNRVVLLLHGFGEEQTRRAAHYLINYWNSLYKQYGREGFGVSV